MPSGFEGHARSSAPERRLEKLRRRRKKLSQEIDALEHLLAERESLREQLDAVRDLAERVMTVCDGHQDTVLRLEREMKRKEQLITDLEAENDTLIQQMSRHAERIEQLERTLSVLAQAEERVEARQ